MTDSPKRRWYAFRLRTLLVLVVAVPICVGWVAAIEIEANHLSHIWYGIEWQGDVRHFLMDNGVSPVNEG